MSSSSLNQAGSNSPAVNVANGMIKVMEVLEHHTKEEKYAIIGAVFNCMYNHKFKDIMSVGDVLLVADRLRDHCKQHQVPEFGGAERFIQGEL